jgi:hypothetical protein
MKSTSSTINGGYFHSLAGLTFLSELEVLEDLVIERLNAPTLTASKASTLRATRDDMPSIRFPNVIRRLRRQCLPDIEKPGEGKSFHPVSVELSLVFFTG